MNKLAVVTGITGQDGSYLAELLLQKDIRWWAVIEGHQLILLVRIKHILKEDNLELVEFDLTDPSGCNQLISHLSLKKSTT